MTLEGVLALISAEDPDTYQEAAKFITDLDAAVSSLTHDIIERDTELETLRSTVETLKAENASLRKINAELFLKSPGQASEDEHEVTLEDITKMIFNK